MASAGEGSSTSDRHEAALEGGVVLDVLAVLVVGGRADAGKLAPRQRRLQLVGGVLRALAAGAGADEHVQLVDEDDDAGRPRASPRP